MQRGWVVLRDRARRNLYADAFFTERFVMLDREVGDNTAVRQLKRIMLQRSTVCLAEQVADADLELRLKSNLAALIAEASLPDPSGRSNKAIRLYAGG